MNKLCLGTQYWAQAQSACAISTCGVLSMNSATQTNPQPHRLWFQNTGKNKKYSKM